MHAQETCRRYEELSAFVSGQLSAEEIETIAQHLESCTRCEALVASLFEQSDSIVTALRRQLPIDTASSFDIAQVYQASLTINPPTTATPRDAALPIQLGPYRLVRKIGQGGMGAVYEAFHVNLKRRVAFKTVRAEQAGEPLFVRRFELEMEAIGRLDHPNIVRASDAGEFGGTPFLVMEYLEGMSLNQLLRRTGRLETPAVLEIARQTALGLEYASQHGLIHRDIKPSNLFLTNQGQIKIIDLGLVKLLSLWEGPAEATSSGRILGTADYIAPEQARQLDDLDIRADVYSLGCTLYELLTGRPPFPTSEYPSASAKIVAHCTEVPLPIDRLRADVPPLLQQLVERMLAKLPHARPFPSDVAQTIQTIGDPLVSTNLSSLLLETAALPAVNQLTLKAAPRDIAKTFLPRSKTALLAWAAVGIVILVAISSAFLTGEPQARRLERQSPPATEPLVWHNQLQQAPTVVFWPGGEVARFAWDPNRKDIVFNCDDHGLLALGSCQAKDYRLQLGIRQVRWTGGLGMFFGLHDIQFEGALAQRFQFLQLNSIPIGSRKFTLSRGWGILSVGQDGQRHFKTKTVCEAMIPDPIGQQLLEVEIRRGQLQNVFLNGVVVSNLVDPQYNREFEPEDQAGRFGLGALVSEGVINSAQLKVLDSQR